MAVRQISTTTATLLVLLAACCFGSVVILASLAEQGGATLATVLFWRYAIGGVVLVAVAGGVRRSWGAGGRAAWRLLVLGGGGQLLVAGVSLKALDFIPAATLAFLFYTYPAWVAVFAALRGSERIDATRGTALVLSLAGIATMVGAPWHAGGALDARGVALALASAVIYALYIPLIDRLSAGHAPAAAAAHVALGVAVLIGLGGPVLGQVVTARLSPVAWGAVTALAVLSTALAFIVFLRGLRELGPVRTAIVSTVEPFWTALLAAAVLAQPLHGSTIAGGALIAGAVLLLQRRPREVPSAA